MISTHFHKFIESPMREEGHWQLGNYREFQKFVFDAGMLDDLGLVVGVPNLSHVPNFQLPAEECLFEFQNYNLSPSGIAIVSAVKLNNRFFLEGWEKNGLGWDYWKWAYIGSSRFVKIEKGCWLSYVDAALKLLNCTNITTETISSPKKLNKKRESKGKVPIDVYKILKIPGMSSRINSQGSLETTGEIRLHHRRGNIHHLKSGDYWWNPCLVGNPQKGQVHKTYDATGLGGNR